MPDPVPSARAALPSVDRILRLPQVAALVREFGRGPTTEAVRAAIAESREAVATDRASNAAIAARAQELVAAGAQPSLRPVINLTGTVLHTNLGRAPLPPEAVAAIAAGAGAANLEYDLATGRRGDRDSHVEDLLVRLTGAEAATIVNNNAAAVLLLLNSLANRREVPVSRGELIEIGGAFRMPDIMARAGCRLVEVGTTNRTHARDFADAIGPRTALLMKVHRSNYAVEGFTAEVPEAELARIAHDSGLPFAVDLGSGTLVDLARYGLPHEPTPMEALAAGADLVTFSTDKLLGGPQGGVVVGRADLVKRLKRNPMKRALRCGKLTIAALGAVLRLYADPDRLAERLPTVRLLARPYGDIEALAQRLAVPLAQRLAAAFDVAVVPCRSQLGSGSLPMERLESAGLALRPLARRGVDGAIKRLAAAFRSLPVPVVGRIADGALLFDLRCLEDESAFVASWSTCARDRRHRRPHRPRQDSSGESPDRGRR